MLGAIAGDIIGSYYEGFTTKKSDFPLFNDCLRFTDDTVLTAAVAEWILHGRDLVDLLQEYFEAYPDAGYGGTFIVWCRDKLRQPYDSWGNGSAMRVSPVAWAYDSLDQVLEKARDSAMVTHSHEEGVRGAQAAAAAVFMARMGKDKMEIKRYIETTFGYDLSQTLDDIRPDYEFDVSCQGSVPQSIIAFLESNDFEQALRNAISLGGDADTMACIAGAVAEAFYGEVPPAITEKVFEILDGRIAATVNEFRAKFIM